MRRVRRAQYWELHITFKYSPRTDLREAVELKGWKYSAIVGDPILGEGAKSYATKHLNKRRYTQQQAVDYIEEWAAFFYAKSFHVVRVKVEDVVYDCVGY